MATGTAGGSGSASGLGPEAVLEKCLLPWCGSRPQIQQKHEMYCLPLLPPLALLIRCLSHRHEDGCAWPLILSPLSPSPGHSILCSFLPQFLQFLPLPPAAEHLLSSPCKPHLDFRAERLQPWLCSCRAVSTGPSLYQEAERVQHWAQVSAVLGIAGGLGVWAD